MAVYLPAVAVLLAASSTSSAVASLAVAVVTVAVVLYGARVGIALSGQVATRARTLLTPLRDLFAAVFFVFFGLQVDPRGLPPVAGGAAAVGLAAAATKVATG